MRSNSWSIEAWYEIMQGGISADVIAIGSSRAWVQIDPLIIDSILNTNSFNLGIDGSPINRQIHKYNIYRRYNSKPKLIVQNIDLWTLGYGVGYEKEQFLPYFWDKWMREEMIRYEPFSWYERYLPLCRYFDYGYKHFRHHNPRQLTKGYKGMERPWNGRNYMEVDSIIFTPNETSLRMFDEYLSKAKAEGIKVVFVYAPQYIGATNKISYLDKMYKQYREFSDKYNIPILDYTYMDICYDTTYFYNAMHLNKRGAEIYSDSLANDIKRLNILGK